MKMLIRAIALLGLAALTACGGGGGSTGTAPFGGGSGSAGSDTTGVSSNASGTVVMSINSNTISSSAPGTVTALVKDAAGKAVSTVVKFSVSSDIATVSPETVLTDSTGQASTGILPTSSAALGAAYVTASAETSSGTLSTKLAFSVSAVNVTLNSLLSSLTTLPAYASTSVNVVVTGASASSPLTVTFSSNCMASGKAVISPASLSLASGTGSVTYQDKGCNGTDRITASITGTSQQKTLDLVVQAPTTQSIQFVSASPTTICLAGSGCSASSIVTFKVADQFGNPVAGVTVDFALDITGVAALSYVTANTNSAGIADVSIQSKTTPTPIRVKASVRGSTLTTVSNTLAINSGLPTQNTLSFSATAYNIDGKERDGETSAITMRLTDRFANPVPDGTAVSFVAEGASVIPATCFTVLGSCSVNFVSSEYRPPNGRVSLVAYAQGEESFSDQNGDNLYTPGEVFTDSPPVYVDKNENEDMDAGEYIAGSAIKGQWDGNTYISVPAVFILSSNKLPRLYDVLDGSTCSDTVLGDFTLTVSDAMLSQCQAQKLICIRDANIEADSSNGNPLPTGATLSVSTNSKDATVTIDNSPIQNRELSPTMHVITAKLSDCSKDNTPGTIELKIKMPNSGNTYTFPPLGTVN